MQTFLGKLVYVDLFHFVNRHNSRSHVLFVLKKKLGIDFIQIF